MSLANAIKRASRVYIIGNGGSYSNSVHMVNDLLSVGIRAFAMDPATLTAFANDYNYETVFSRWLLVVAEKGDLLITLSGSGKSPNILNAIATAELIGVDVFRIFGAERGENMQLAEEMQLRLGHDVMLEIRSER